ncbi:MAG: hypothetical protein P4N59_11570 [Negativicutes bacterium]|nr:hypothetical protein [Negativicutes bacterium]
MFALSPSARRFVIAMLEFPSASQAKAAGMAGFSGSPENLSSTGWRLAHDPKVQAAIQEEARKRMGAATILAVSKLVELVDQSTDKKVQLRAIEMLLNRTGFNAITEHNINVNNVPSDDEGKIKRIELLCSTLGIDAQKLLGAAASTVTTLEKQAIEAEWEEVQTHPGSEGLEDLLG